MLMKFNEISRMNISVYGNVNISNGWNLIKLRQSERCLLLLFMSISAAIQGSTEHFKHETVAFLHSNWMVKAAAAAVHFSTTILFSLVSYVYACTVRHIHSPSVCTVQCCVSSLRFSRSWVLRIQWTQLTWSNSALCECMYPIHYALLLLLLRTHTQSFSNVDSTTHWIPVRVFVINSQNRYVMDTQTDGVVFIAIATEIPYMPP